MRPMRPMRLICLMRLMPAYDQPFLRFSDQLI